MTRVAVTGVGVVTAAGLGMNALWKLILSEETGVRPLSIPRDEILAIGIAASVPDFDPAEHLEAEILKRCDRYTQFADIASREAVEQADLDPDLLSGRRTAVLIGTGVGGMVTLDSGYAHLAAGKRLIDPLTVPKLIPSSAASHVSIRYGVTGPCFAICSACSSASQSIGTGMMLIRAGIVDRVIAGGSEACLTAPTVRGWELMRILSPDGCKPFSKTRNGIVLGEGAGIVVLESEQALAERGARPLVWLSGYGTTSDARDMIQPDVDGAAAAMQGALDDARLRSDQIDYINAHGTGTVIADVNESVAVRRVFGDYTDSLPVSSSKPVIGHMLGASGAAELAISVRAMTEETVPPHVNCSERDPKCQLFLSTEGSIRRPIRHAMSNTFAFGGINASLIISAPE